MDRLVIDLDQLASLKSQLSRITNSLENDASFSVAISEHVGHERLAASLRNFASSWNIHRQGIVENLQTVNKWVGEVDHSFRDLDTRLSEGLSPEEPSQGRTLKTSSTMKDRIA